MKIPSALLKFIPDDFIRILMKLNKGMRRHHIKQQMKKGGYTTEQIERDLREIGIMAGDSVLVHGSLSKMGFVEGGADSVIIALTNVIGNNGTLLMPSFPAPGRNKDYLDGQSVFDVKSTASAMGVLSEHFRTMPGVERSLHPTDSVSARGPLADFYVSTHLGQTTPYNEQSPFRKLAEKAGKILMLGTSLNGACTSLHMLEDAVDFPYPVYLPELYTSKIIDKNGAEHIVQTRVHNPMMSSKRDADALLPWFEVAGIVKKRRICEAPSMLIDAKGLFETMIHLFHEKGVTMYSPLGIKEK